MGSFWKIVTLFVLGAILYDVLSHPKGTKALGQSVTGFLETGLKYASGR